MGEPPDDPYRSRSREEIERDRNLENVLEAVDGLRRDVAKVAGTAPTSSVSDSLRAIAERERRLRTSVSSPDDADDRIRTIIVKALSLVFLVVVALAAIAWLAAK